MKINRRIESGFDMQSVAGFGPSAWNRDSGSVEIASMSRRSGSGHHIVRVDHEERKRAVAEDSEALRNLSEEQFRSSEPLIWRILESSVGFALIGSSLFNGL